MTIKAILFDMDGTLIDSEPIHFASHQKALRSVDIELTEEEYIAKGASVDAIIFYNNLAKLYNKTFDAQSVHKIAVEYAISHKNDVKLFENVKHVIDFAKSHAKIALVTGSNRATAVAYLKHFALYDLFEFIVTGDDVKHTKPAPDPYLAAAKRLEVEPEHCFVIEDSGNGMKAAKIAGCTCAVVPNKFTRLQDFTQADYILTDILHVKEILEKKL